ncbi:MAG: hypothetical protein AB8G95_29470 [Anaerolineae bacterium]
MSSIKKFFFVFIVLAGLLFSLSLNSSSAQASVADTAKWYTHMSVDNGQIIVEWTVETGYVSGYPQNWVVVNRSVTKLKCWPSGSVQVNFDHVIFNGQSYLKCAVPSFAKEVSNLSNGSIMLEPVLETQSILTIVDAKLDNSRGMFSNPVFAMQDNLDLFIPIKKGSASMKLLYPNGVTNSSNLTTFGRSQFTIEENCTFSSCTFDHSVGNSTVNSDPAPFIIEMPTGETTLVFGYSPAHKTYLQGIVYDVFIDPFTRGPGSG